ncbi:MAG: ParA family partition ATPase [Alphaproteobacteria bacterium]
MVGRVITVAQQKGGAGKSTLAAHLAVFWSRQKKSVALIDIDPQGSLSAWYETRKETLSPDKTGITFHAVTGWRTKNTVDSVCRDHDIVIIDSPPHAETESKIAVRAADLVVVPTQPSPMDIWATRPTLDMAEKEKSSVMAVLNRVPPRASLTARMVERLNGLGVAVAAATIGNRVAFAESMAEGLTAVESKPRSVAAAEIRALAAELFRHR